MFVAVLQSSWESGSVVGIRDAGGIIRFVGISNSSNGLVMTRLILNTTGDVINSVSGQLGTAVSGITRLTGIG